LRYAERMDDRSRTIVVAIDRPDPVLVQASRDLARTYEARLLLVHVKETAMMGARIDEEHVADDLVDAVRELRCDGIDAELELHTAPVGRAGKVLADVARSHRAGLMVAGASRQGRMARLVHGATLRRLEARAACPLLLVPLDVPVAA
jgi:nucleotide-binding universal stress UspA family protein